jgi:diguanylate cyclase (GGDEF)-like protein
MEDITERKKAEEQIRQLAFYDTLTHLPNRRLLLDRLGKAMAVSKRSNRFGAMMFLDLDKFKSLNDTHGHDMGDLLLIEVARRITCCLREMDTVARFGGDEFVVMLSELTVEKQPAREKAGCVAEKIRVTLAEPYYLTGKPGGDAEICVKYHCTSSIGVVLFKSHDANQQDILKWADMAMYQAKADGRNKIRFFEESSRMDSPTAS